MKDIFEIIDNHFEEYKQFWIDICNIESKSSDKLGVDKVADYIERFCAAKGFQIKRQHFDKSGDYLAISMNTDSTLPGMAFMAHMDTVHEKGKFGEPPVKERDGYLHGPGVIDCKGGIPIAFQKEKE